MDNEATTIAEETRSEAFKPIITHLDNSDIFDLLERVYFIDFFNSNNDENSENLENKKRETNSQNEEATATHINLYKDVVEFELRKLQVSNEPLDKNELKQKIKQLKSQLNVVGRRVSDIILQNSHAYSQELQRVSNFKLLLEDSYQICSIARRSLHMNELLFIAPTLKLIKKQANKLHRINLLNAIQGIR
jgi:hypothetical protein